MIRFVAHVAAIVDLHTVKVHVVRRRWAGVSDVTRF